jgi:ubiquinone/menaquinone biosynthesis C-methylase UbiE
MKLVPRIPLTDEAIKGDETIAEYERYASIYMQPEYWYFARQILRRGFKGGRVLDIGTGSGRLAFELAKYTKKDCKIVGLDLSSGMLKYAGARVTQDGLADRLSFVQSSADRLPFNDGTFDLVISYASLHHWRQPEAVINEMARVLKENGKLIIRDNRRVTGEPFWELFVRLIGCFMSRKRYLNWRKVILASYTLPEVEVLLKRTSLKTCCLGTDFVQFDLHIEAVKY